MKTPQHTNTTNGKQEQHFTFLSYHEEGLLDWGATITTPPRELGQYGLS